MSNTTFMRFPGGRLKAFTMSYDDGVEQDIRLIEIMKKNGLKGTFNLNSGRWKKPGTVYKEGNVHRIMSYEQAIEVYADSGMEVAIHAKNHPSLEKLAQPVVAYEIVTDRHLLEKQFGRIVRGMAYPYGTTSDDVVDALDVCGVAYARTTIETGDFKIPQTKRQWLKLETTCRHASPNLFAYGQKFLDLKPGNAPKMFYLWGHSYEFEESNNWDMIEKFAEMMGGHDDIWYATNIEIYDYVNAYRSLVYSVDGNIVTNPTSQKIWFNVEKSPYVIEPGETIVINRDSEV